MKYKIHVETYRSHPPDTLVVDEEAQMWALLDGFGAVWPPLKICSGEATEEEVVAWVEERHPHWKPFPSAIGEMRSRISKALRGN